jgi:hypothetical protein
MAKSGPLPRATYRSQILAPLQTNGRTVALTILKLIGPLLMVVLALGVRPTGRVRAGVTSTNQAAGVAVTYPAGWNLVAFPPRH